MRIHDRLLVASACIVALVFALIPFHAPLTVYFGALFGFEEILKAWKEMLILTGLLCIWVARTEKIVRLLKKDRLLQLIAGYTVFHLIIAVLLSHTWWSAVAGLMVDLRYLAFFTLVYLVVTLYPAYNRYYLRIVIAGMAIVAFFGLLQVVLLPRDILSTIGYSAQTILPYQLVDQDENLVRINSTLRGPNPLGAYMIIGIVFAALLLLRKKDNIHRIGAGIFAITGVIVLWHAYSRSAVVAAIVAVGVALFLARQRLFAVKSSKYWLLAGAVVICSLFLLKSPDRIQQIVFHNNPSEQSAINSDDQRVTSIQDATQSIIIQPQGHGVGSSGSASIIANKPVVIENQWLFVAYEVGVVGLFLFAAIICVVFIRLYQKKQYWLPVAVFSSGIGLVFVGLFLPVFIDDTVSLVWWGCAALALGHTYKKEDEL